MARAFFLTTERVGFSKWRPEDLELAELLWGDPDVTKYICASGRFSTEEVANRLKKEVANDTEYQVQYWPVFALSSHELVGCCGLRPHDGGSYEIGFHLRPTYWRQGYGMEAAQAVIHYAFSVLKAPGLFAGHHPSNTASSNLLLKLGFQYMGDQFYQPTGLYHPSYELKAERV